MWVTLSSNHPLFNFLLYHCFLLIIISSGQSFYGKSKSPKTVGFINIFFDSADGVVSIKLDFLLGYLSQIKAELALHYGPSTHFSSECF